MGTKSGRTRERLLRIARDVLTKDGFSRATIREIAARAGVNPALLHYYFGSKAGLHAAVVEQVSKQVRSTLEGVRGGSGSASDRLRALVRAYILVLGQERYLAQMMVQQLLLSEEKGDRRFQSEIGQPLVSGLTELLEEGMASGEFKAFDQAFLVSSILANCLGFAISAPLLEGAGRLRASSQTAMEAWANSVSDLVLDGLTKR